MGRCSRCKGEGHTRRTCPHDDDSAEVFRQAWLDSERRRRDERRRQWEEERRQYERTRWINWAMAQRPDYVATSASGPTKSQVKIQELLFDNSEKIPEGLYKDLMDALVIK